MKKLIICLMFMICISTVSGEIYIDTQGIQKQAQGLLASVKAFFIRSDTCSPNWQYQDTCIQNDTIVRIYTDYNNCGLDYPEGHNSLRGWCNYCSQMLIDEDVDACPAYDGESLHNITVFDANWKACCNETGLSDDCYRDDTTNFNRTYFETEVCEVETNMWEFAVIILPFLFGVLLITGSVGLSEEHNVMRIFMFILSFITIFASMNYASIIIAYRYPVFTEIQDALGQTVFWAGRFVFILIVYFMMYAFIKLVHYMAEKKRLRLEY